MFLGLGVLGFGLSIEGKIRVGIFLNGEEFFVRFSDGCVVAHQSLCPTELEPGQWAGDKFPAQTGIVNQLLEPRSLLLSARPVRRTSPSSPDRVPFEFALPARAGVDSDAKGADKNAYKSLPVKLSIG